MGNSVIRHRVVRRLRHRVVANLASFPAGSDVVVRALPGIDKLNHVELQNNFDVALAKVAS